ncbi:putative gamma-tubulin complex component protein [Helianthus debilis subsp. tardiflorus]
MNFLLRVKRAKFVVDKARRWMWKVGNEARRQLTESTRGWRIKNFFIDAFHQYVMDRVYHSSWSELCEGMAAVRSLDEVIQVHEAYLLSIHYQCFVVLDKLWALIASRINKILGLDLDFYSVQQTLSSGRTVAVIKARCHKEVDRIDKQFDDCMAFLLTVLSFKLNVGQFPHLADLVMRINYNKFHISDTGKLITAPASDFVNFKLANTISV